MRKTYTIWGVIALLAVLLAYANSFNNGFHFDDFHTATDNPSVRSLKNVPSFFTDATTFSVLPANRTYRPIVSTSLAFDYAMGHGYVPLWFHVSTFAFFLLLLWLLSMLYESLLEATGAGRVGRWIGLGTAAWFGLHPAIAETVNYVIQRGDLYCTLGCVAALVIYVRWPQRRSLGIYLLPLVFALLSKPPAAVFPVLIFFYVFFFEARGRRVRTGLLAALPSAVVTGVLLWVQSAMTPRSFTPSILSPWEYRMTQPYVWLRYFGELLAPLHLNVDTDLGAIAGVDARVVAGLVFLVLLGVAIGWTARRRQLYPIAYGLIWFVVTQLPTSAYPLSEVENDHRMFFSFVGLMLAVAWSAWLAIERIPAAWRSYKTRPAWIALLVLLLSGYAWGVHVRNAVWHDEESLWLDDVQKSPHNGRGLMIYGLTQMNKGAYPGALDYFTRALEFTPNYPTLEINLGVVNGAMSDQGEAARTAEAEQHFLRAIQLAPNDDTAHAFYGRWLKNHGRANEGIAQLREAIALNPARMMQRDELIDAYQRNGDADEARKTAQETLALAPDDAAASVALEHPPTQNATWWVDLSLSQYRLGQYAQSIESARRALALDPKSAEAYNNIGAGYAGMQEWDNAVANEREALRLKPDLQIAQNNLRLYLQRHSAAKPVTATPVVESAAADALLSESLQLNLAGKFEESIAAAKRVLVLNPQSAEAWNNIAAGNEALKRWDTAIAAANKAIALKPDFQLAKNNLAWSQQQKKLGVH